MKKLIPFLCVLAYFLSPYRIAGHEMPEIIFLIALFLVGISKPIYAIDKKYITYMIYMWTIPPIFAVVNGIPGNYILALLPVALILTSCYICFVLPNVNKVLILKYYRVLVYAAVVLFVIQEISSITIGYRPTLYLPFFEMYYEGADVASFSASRAGMDRSSSFFLEPSHFAQYILPYYCIILSRYLESKKGFKETLCFTLVLLFLRAGVGYIALIVIGSFFFLKSKYLKLYQRIAIACISIVGFILITLYFSDTAFISSIMERTSELSLDVEAYGAQSGFIRIWRGYFIYDAMDLINKIFGVSIAGLDYVSNAVYIPGSRYEGTFVNGIQGLLITGGVVGLFLFFRYIWHLLRKLNITGQSILVAMITLFFMEHMLNTSKMFLYILLASCFPLLNSYDAAQHQS